MAKKVKKPIKSAGLYFKLILSLVVILVIGLILTLNKNTVSKININEPKAEQVSTQSVAPKPAEKAATPSAIPKTQVQAIGQKPQVSGRSLRVPILTYHYIGNNPNPLDTARDGLSVSPINFEEQMKYLSENGYKPISLDTLYAALKGQATLPEKAIILTFDDAYIDFYINAYPILRQYNLHATVFVPTGLIGQTYYMTWDQIGEVDKSGLVVFQAHSLTHPNLTAIPPTQISHELSESRVMLQNFLGKPVNFMAYPYGSSNAMVWEAAKSAGYLGAVGTYYGNIQSEGAIYNLPRIKIGNFSIEDFASRL